MKPSPGKFFTEPISRRQALEKKIKYVGLDVQKNSIMIAVAGAGAGAGCVRGAWGSMRTTGWQN
jgi:hypothetical protein